MEFRAAEIEALGELVPEAQKIVQILKGRKTNAPQGCLLLHRFRAARRCWLSSKWSFPIRPLCRSSAIIVQKWRPLRHALPAGELDALGVPRGPKFDKILDQLFEMQLRGRARTPEDRTKALRQLAGMKEEPKKKPEKEKKKRGEKGTTAAAEVKSGAKRRSNQGDRRCRAFQVGGCRHWRQSPSQARRSSRARPKHKAVPPKPKQSTAEKERPALTGEPARGAPEAAEAISLGRDFLSRIR